ncbi:MAG: CCA tRNA nucleotidyltransferase [Planctomycetota bacterium]|nr:CCA tRNA nucleotidyltransferase [Planctomycetota bacterium]MDA1211280.1 CCA tRNA nucleotidyltransferase [Planctomycetota bacterium]
MANQPTHREFTLDVVRQLQDAGYIAYWAGGCVRDVLLGREPKDYDVATNAHPDQVRELFGKRKTLEVGLSFGVVIVVGTKSAGNVEVATFRTEGDYHDGRRPSHVAFCTPEADAMRRDFTINGMFYDPVHQQIHDFVEGQRDLGNGLIRAIGNPGDRMREDKLRMLRGVRFTASLEFQLDEATAQAIRSMSSEIYVVSAERIAQELKKMLIDRHRANAMSLARELNLFQEILPEWKLGEPQYEDDWTNTLQALHLLDEPSFELAFAALVQAVHRHNTANGLEAEIVSAIVKRFRLSNREHDRIVWLVAQLPTVETLHQRQPSVWKRLMSHDGFAELVALARVVALAEEQPLDGVLFCEEMFKQLSPEQIAPALLLTGDDLIQLGLQSGPDFKRILEAVRDAQLNGEISTADEARQLALKL